MACWHDCSSTRSWGGKTFRTNCSSSVVTKYDDPLHAVFQSHMLNQGQTECQKWRGCWQLEMSPKINWRKGHNCEARKGAKALGIFKLLAYTAREPNSSVSPEPCILWHRSFHASLNMFDTGFPAKKRTEICICQGSYVIYWVQQRSPWDLCSDKQRFMTAAMFFSSEAKSGEVLSIPTSSLCFHSWHFSVWTEVHLSFNPFTKAITKWTLNGYLSYSVRS